MAGEAAGLSSSPLSPLPSLHRESHTQHQEKEGLNLSHSLPQDVCHHLVVMSWEDWSPAVRDAASQALGKTGHGNVNSKTAVMVATLGP